MKYLYQINMGLGENSEGIHCSTYRFKIIKEAKSYYEVDVNGSSNKRIKKEILDVVQSEKFSNSVNLIMFQFCTLDKDKVSVGTELLKRELEKLIEKYKTQILKMEQCMNSGKVIKKYEEIGDEN